VRYHVNMIPQQTGMGCWAASIAMIFGWAQRVCIDPGAIAAREGYQQYLSTGLPPNDDSILRAWGIYPEAPQNYTIAGFMQLLQQYGPLWIAAAVPGAHVRVVTGFDPHADASKATVYINDPWEQGMKQFRLPNHGARYTMSYLRLVKQEETLAKRELFDPVYASKLPIYVAHLARKPHSD
jgi:hypothetical protein